MESCTLRSARAGAYENPRPEVQAVVPLEAGTILDLGCSSGALGGALRARQPCTVTGIERDPAYAADAGARLDRVLTADLETLIPAKASLHDFDCLIAADVLEHLRDPWTVLRRFAATVRPGGTVIVSLPNVRFWATFAALGLRGTWPLADEGIFDHSHLRWFALADGRRLLEQAGLHVTREAPQYRLRPGDWRSEAQGRRFARTPLAPFFVFQYVLCAIKPGS